MSAGQETTERRSATKRANGFLAIADDPADDEDLRRQKRVGVVAGYATIFAPLTLPIEASARLESWILAFGLSAFAIANLIGLARSRNFERFVVALIAAGVVFVPTATLLTGGLTGPGSGLVWAFLIPAYAMLALGPKRSVRWFAIYLALIVVMVIFDPVARSLFQPPATVVLVFGIVFNAVVPLAIVFALLLYTDTRRIAAEARVDELLTNAIPRSIANRLRRGERRIAELYPDTSVVFADIVGFTPYARRTEPNEVVSLLDDLFTRFDELADRHGLEKIKTIGDAYMAVAGAPQARPDHAAAAVSFGRGLIDAVAAYRASTGVPIEVRIGVASGPAVGGVIGQRRLQFDLWGDTVNLASRMESSGVAGRIQIAELTSNLLGEEVSSVPREVDVKGLGPLTAYLLT